MPWLLGSETPQRQWSRLGYPGSKTPGTVALSMPPSPAHPRAAEEESGTEPERGGLELESALCRLPGSPGRIRPEPAAL